MENASKALLIAAGVLIAILILTLFSYLMRQMGSSTSGIYSKLSQREITEFNQKFLNYEGRENLSIQDVITIVNLAIDSNKNVKIPSTISVLVRDEIRDENWVGKSKEEINDLLKSNLDKQYICSSVTIDTSTLFVKEVKINQKDDH